MNVCLLLMLLVADKFYFAFECTLIGRKFAIQIARSHCSSGRTVPKSVFFVDLQSNVTSNLSK